MNGRFLGEESVAERVRQAAADLDYQPNHLARSLALGKTRAIAFVVPDLANPAFQAVLSSLSKTAAKDGYRVLVADSAESPSDEPLLAAEVRRRCDALILCAPRMGEAELRQLAVTVRPLVLINRMGADVAAPALSIDYETGARKLAEHLCDLGHRHLVYLAGPQGSVSNGYRLRGLDAFAAAAPEVRIDRLPGGVSSDDGIAAAQAVIDSGATAVIAFNDLVAIGLLHALEGRGVQVPQDVSVTGFDDIPFARFSQPALTTVSVPHEELGVQAWHRMHALIQGEAPDVDVVYQPQLEVRESTAAPRSL